MLSASVIRTILSDMIRLYFENRKAKGKGCLVFNPDEPETSKYITVRELEQDLAIAQEAMDREITNMFEKIIKVIRKRKNKRTNKDHSSQWCLMKVCTFI